MGTWFICPLFVAILSSHGHVGMKVTAVSFFPCPTVTVTEQKYSTTVTLMHARNITTVRKKILPKKAVYLSC